MEEPHDEVPSCCFDEWAASNARRARSGRSARIIRAMLDDLTEVGLEGRTLLDVGCGAGDLALGALDRGATSVAGIDLGPGAIDHARALADERGYWERVSFEVGDGSRAALKPADVVVMSRVVCCYADPGGLLENVLPAAGSVVAWSAPVDHGLAGFMNRALFRTANLWYRLRSSKFRGFRTFVHDLDQIDARVRAAGFTERRRERSRFVWELAVYTR